MLVNTAFTLLAVVCSAVQATAIPDAGTEVRTVQPLIATDNYVACNCPNNCSYRVGHSCKYWAPNGKDIISGKCVYGTDDKLYCA